MGVLLLIAAAFLTLVGGRSALTAEVVAGLVAAGMAGILYGAILSVGLFFLRKGWNAWDVRRKVKGTKDQDYDEDEDEDYETAERETADRGETSDDGDRDAVKTSLTDQQRVASPEDVRTADRGLLNPRFP
jgi:hypothetical protein